MPNYDFTVRATDNLGAYSDRTFTIAVKNTNVERFVVVGTSGLAHSPTGLPGTWTLESGMSGFCATYGNGQWVVWSLANLTIRTSLDGVNWSSYTVSFGDAPGFPTGGVPKYVTCFKYRNQSWRMWGLLQYGGSSYRALEYTSNDLVNWTATGRSVGAAGGVTTLVNDIEYDPATNRWVVEMCDGGAHQIWTAVGNAPFTQVYTGGGTTRRTNGSVALINGQWCVQAGNGPAVSVDGMNWTYKNLAATTGYPWFMTYTNGRLFLQMRNVNSAAASMASNYSLNGGRTWVATQTISGTNGASDAVQSIASYGNVVVALTGVDNQIAISQNSGTNFSVSTLSGLGTVYGVAVRDD